ncbi:hypothetical protein N7466_009708 [Penicillium verhagenii]|uniref:uncharacterized protein n=1 Tax=Penicillium verhagenii TaxID=1562060 RepID=UPI002545972F|nr:uncharacterized protein N7466_009708 [Penicillium verhagenii]KAJ5921382.1 hypothetical protein N7466_009708 [Penicillium verhagenii]
MDDYLLPLFVFPGFEITLLLKAVEESSRIFGDGSGEQWKHLIRLLLERLDKAAPGGDAGTSNQSNWIVVIDALDECGGGGGANVILKLLHRASML